MKKLKIRQIINGDFAWAIVEIMNYPLPIKAGYWLRRIFKKVQSHEKIYNEARIEGLKKYCKPGPPQTKDGAVSNSPPFEVDDKGNAVFKSKDDEAAFKKDIEELLEQEVEIPTMSASLLLTDEDLKIPAKIITLLEEVIVPVEET